MNRFAFVCVLVLTFSACQSPSGNTAAPATPPAAKPDAPQCGFRNPLPAGATAGLVLLNLDAPADHTVVFYRDSLLLQEWFHSGLYQWHPPADFAAACPAFHKPDYGIVHFACAGQTKNAWKLQGADGTVFWVKKEMRHSFRTWEGYLQQSFGIRRALLSEAKKSQPLRVKPSAIAASVAIPAGEERFCTMAVKGDWVQVTWDCHHGDPAYQGQNCHEVIGDCAPPVSGWLRWRSGQELLVDVFLMP